MVTITVENVPENIVKLYWTKVNFSYNLFINDDCLDNNFDIDFKKLSNSEITPELLKSIEETKKIPKSKLINLSKEYANY